MREHVRGNGRYFRTEQGAMTLDWGSNGVDYKELDFSYVVQGRLGNMRKLYGRIRRNADGETYDTYDVMAGNDRLKTTGAFNIEAAIRGFVHAMTGVMPVGVSVDGKMPMLPDSAKEPMENVLRDTLSGMKFCFRGDVAEWSDTLKDAFIGAFIAANWRNEKLFVDSVKEGVVAVGLVNVAVGKYSNLHRMFRDACDSLLVEGSCMGVNGREGEDCGQE